MKKKVTLKDLRMKQKIFDGGQHNYHYDYFILPAGTEVLSMYVSPDMEHLWLEWYTGEIAQEEGWRGSYWFHVGDRIYDRAEVDVWIIPYAMFYDFSNLIGIEEGCGD